jgi:hypothetical protein
LGVKPFIVKHLLIFVFLVLIHTVFQEKYDLPPFVLITFEDTKADHMIDWKKTDCPKVKTFRQSGGLRMVDP